MPEAFLIHLVVRGLIVESKCADGVGQSIMNLEISNSEVLVSKGERESITILGRPEKIYPGIEYSK